MKYVKFFDFHPYILHSKNDRIVGGYCLICMNTQTNIDIELEGFGEYLEESKKKKPKLFDSYIGNAIKTFSLTVGLTYFLICLMYVCFQDSFLYKPSKKLERVPVHSGHSFMNLMLKTSDNEKINAWFVPSGFNKGTVLYCRGNKGNLSNDLDVIETWNKNGYNVMSFDYRGFGISTGTPSEDGLYKDARAAYKWLKENHLTEKRFILHGHSLGGGVASKLAVEVDCDGLILESTFTNLKDLTQMKFWALPSDIICFSEFPTDQRLSAINAPVYIIHSPEDRHIPFQMGQKLYRSAKEPKMFLTLQDHDYDFPIYDRQYARSLASFANSLERH